MPGGPRRLGRAAAASLLATVLCTCLAGCFSAPPQIISLEPNRGSTSVLADAPVRVVFDRPVVPSSVVGRFTVTPSVPGCDLVGAFTASSTSPCWVRWLPGDTGFELHHEQAVFAPATRYEFTLAGGFTDARGDSNGLDHHWDLTSAAAPRVGSLSPADGATGVAVDASLAIAFSTAMDPPATAAAIRLQPAVPGTRVVRNLTDHTRFVVLPGRLLAPATAYTITVGAGARGEDNQVIAAGAPFTSHFTTGAHLGGAHAAVLAAVPGEGPTQVLLPALTSASVAEPPDAPLVLEAGRCAEASCGSVMRGAPLETYSAVSIAPDAAHLAVVVQPTTASPSSLEVLDTVHHVVIARFPGAARPSWSPSGGLVAFTAGGGVVVYNAVTGAVATVAETAIVAAPLWAGVSALVLSTGTGGVEVVDRSLDARYNLPGAPAGVAATAISPDGDLVAVTSALGTTLVLPGVGGGGAVQRPAGSVSPVGFTGEGTLVAVAHGPLSAQLVRLNLGGGDSAVVTLQAGLPDLATVRVAPDGRRLGYLALDDQGALQAYVSNADGTGPQALTRFVAGSLEAQAIAFSN